MRKKITVELDASLAREVMALAAEEGISVGALLARYLEQIVQKRRDYARARRRALARLRRGLTLG